MPEPTFDKDGYPTEETLRVIQEWPHPFTGLRAYVKECWRYDDHIRVATVDDFPASCELEKSVIFKPSYATVLITGGWSGNESIVGALESNLPFYGMSWIASYRGGKHLFQFPKERTGVPTHPGPLTSHITP